MKRPKRKPQRNSIVLKVSMIYQHNRWLAQCREHEPSSLLLRRCVVFRHGCLVIRRRYEPPRDGPDRGHVQTDVQYKNSNPHINLANSPFKSPSAGMQGDQVFQFCKALVAGCFGALLAVGNGARIRRTIAVTIPGPDGVRHPATRPADVGGQGWVVQAPILQVVMVPLGYRQVQCHLHPVTLA